ncbi:MAG: hypothetical protein AB1758_36325 [Candidatus Eremiobacterota bacterium]
MVRTRKTRTLSIGSGRLRLEGSGTVRIDWSVPAGYSGSAWEERPYQDTHAVGFQLPNANVWDEDAEDDDFEDEDD